MTEPGSLGGRLRVLFLCTHNSARSQMAEGLLRHLAGDRFEAHSAGTEATFVRPLAVRAMAELGIDISEQKSKTLNRYLREPFDYVVTVCDAANEACPVFPKAKRRLHWSLEDPSRATGSEEERLEVFRSVRDELLERIEKEVANNPTGDAFPVGNTGSNPVSMSGPEEARRAIDELPVEKEVEWKGVLLVVVGVTLMTVSFMFGGGSL